MGRSTFSKSLSEAFVVCVSISQFIDPSPNKEAWLLRRAGLVLKRKLKVACLPMSRGYLILAFV